LITMAQQAKTTTVCAAKKIDVRTKRIPGVSMYVCESQPCTPPLPVPILQPRVREPIPEEPKPRKERKKRERTDALMYTDEQK